MSATETYKGYVIESDSSYMMKHIRFPGSGSVDKALRGSYTQVLLARQAIDTFLETTKGKKNAKRDIDGGDK
jgi:hypothetical protein